MTLKDKIRWGTIAVVSIIVLLFIFFNLESVPINIIIGRVSMPVAFVVIFNFMLGAGTMWVWGVLRPMRKKE
ncbi:MAG: LapA family protein [Candidatus Brocadiae bacterium]|nr:LapA family protein [Candidatus Brocadiia bacterium]